MILTSHGSKQWVRGGIRNYYFEGLCAASLVWKIASEKRQGKCRMGIDVFQTFPNTRSNAVRLHPTYTIRTAVCRTTRVPGAEGMSSFGSGRAGGQADDISDEERSLQVDLRFVLQHAQVGRFLLFQCSASHIPLFPQVAHAYDVRVCTLFVCVSASVYVIRVCL